jgi:peptide/nickel transport system substrate-binding protein
MARSESDIDRRSFLRAAGGAAAATTLAGCGGSPTDTPEGDQDEGTPSDEDETDTDSPTEAGMEPEGTLVYSRGSHSETLDPQQTTSGEDVKVTNQMYNQLIQFAAGGGGELEQGLATEWSLDGTTATLTLKDGIQFHNGEEFTASDFRATFRRFTDDSYEFYLGDAASGYAGFTLGSWIDSVDASSDYELSIELTQQYAPFLRNLAMFASSVISKARIEELGDDQAQLGQEYGGAGTGAFELDTLDDSNERILLTANTDFWGEGPHVAQVVFNTIGENSTRAQSLANGESHVIDGLGAQASQQIQDADSAELLQKDGINIGYMAMNQATREEFRSREVRQAISYAINTEAIVNNIYEGFASQADQPVPPNVMGYNDDLEPYPQDKEEAQSLLEDAGYGDGFSFELATFKNPRGYNPSPIQTAEQVRSDLAEVGIEVTINQQSFGPFLDYTLAGKHDACFLGWYTDNADPDNFFYALLHPQVDEETLGDSEYMPWDAEGINVLNVSAYANREYMQLVSDAQQTYDEATRRENYEQAAQIAHDDAAWVYIDYAQTIAGLNTDVVDRDSYTLSSIGGPYLNQVQLN